jgi:Secretion system C-terminal sorting domain/Ig-like domain CHU_C associated/Glycine rich protein
MRKPLLFSFGILISGWAMAQCVAPPAPTPVTASPSSVCSNTGGSTNLSATTSGNFILWYDAATGGNLLGTSLSAAAFPVTAAVTTTYYAEAGVYGGPLTTDTYVYTGAPQYFVIPAGVDSVILEAWGAQGNSNALSVAGGLGGYATGKLAVNAGDTLWIFVGGGGAVTTAGGYNGGGAGGNGGCAQAFGGGGGGASDVRLGGTTFNDRVIVGAGGGGAAGNRVGGCGRGNGGGGGAGYYGGGGGAAWPGGTPGANPTGGTQSAGGTGGVSTYTTAAPWNNGTNGALGLGGNGGLELTSNQAGSQTATAGGIGGDLNGTSGTYAGNFAGQSGAGGSSYYGTLVNGSTTGGVRTGNGEVHITYQSVCLSAQRTPVTFTVNALPVVTASAAPTTVCDGDSITFSGNGAVTYSWSGPSSVTNGIATAMTVSAAGDYVVTGTDANGCTGMDTVSVAVNALPVVGISAQDSTVCSGDTIVLTASGADTYSWSTGGNAAVEFFIAGVSVQAILTGTETVNGCTSTDTLFITVNQLPVVSFNSSSSAVCIGDTATITASGGTAYMWNTGDTASTISVAPSANTAYSVMVTDANGCMSTDSVSVGVNALPVLDVTGNPSTTCFGTPANLNATGASSFQWSTGDTTSNASVILFASSMVYVTGTDTNGCSSTDSIFVTVNQLPIVTAQIPQNTVCIDDGAFPLLGGSPLGGTWSGPGVTAGTFTPSSATLGSQNIVYTYADSNGCVSSSSDIILVNPCTGVAEYGTESGMIAFPNPATDNISVKWNSEFEMNRIEIVDVTGRVVICTSVANGNNAEINISELPAGMYTLRGVSSTTVVTQMIIKN